MPFTLWYDEVCSQPARVVLDRVQRAEKIPLGDLRIYDLIREGNRPLLWGVYFFYSPEGQCLYVGKNSAQKFVERIPAHLSPAENSWMNHLVKRIKRCDGLSCLTEAADAARGHLLLLMPVGQQEPIKGLEKFFRLFTSPKYNAYPERYRNRYSGLDFETPLTEVLSRM